MGCVSALPALCATATWYLRLEIDIEIDLRQIGFVVRSVLVDILD